MKQKAFSSRNATRLQNYERQLSPHSKDSLETTINPRTMKILITEPRFTRNIQCSDNRSNYRSTADSRYFELAYLE